MTFSEFIPRPLNDQAKIYGVTGRACDSIFPFLSWLEWFEKLPRYLFLAENVTAGKTGTCAVR